MVGSLLLSRIGGPTRWDEHPPETSDVPLHATHPLCVIDHTDAGTVTPVAAPVASTFLARLDDSTRRAFGELGVARRHRRGATVLYEGDTGDGVLFVVEGRLKVLATTADGRELVLGLRGPGELLGELTAIAQDGRPRYATVVALDDLHVRVITGDEFRAFLLRHPTSAIGLLTMLVERLREADRQRVEFGSLDVAHRVARLLVDLAESGSGTSDADGGTDIGIRLTQEELAGMVSASRESLARALGAIRKQDLIRTGRRSIVVLDLDRLRTFAGSP
jgi:CRP/FNR family cyclic AMP-dependent transcriptional regulator